MTKKKRQHLNHQFLIGMMVIFGSALNSFSQCPTVTDAIQSFCDLDAPVIADLSAIDNGNGIRWYATAISTTPLANGLGLINGEDYYADDNSGACGSRQRVDVVVYGPPTGLSFQGVCVDDPDEATIADLIATGNDLQWYNVPNGGSPLALSTILMDNTIYYVNQSNPETGCRTARLSVFVNVGVVPVPIGNDIQEFCSDLQPPPTVADLQASGINNWYQTISSALPLDPSTPLVDGQSYYATTVDPPCESIERLEVTVVLTSPNDSGTNGTIELCETDLSTTVTVNLFDALGGTPESTGVWTGPFTTTNGNLGTVNVTAMTVADSPYVFNYAVSSDSCATSNSTVSITIISALNAGTDGTLTVCETDPPQDLFNSLGGTPEVGGTWTPALSSGTGIFDPAVDAPGIYTYTVAGTPPCGDASALVTVNVNPIPNPGSNGTLTLCETDTTPQNLFDSLGGTPDIGGTWSPALASGSGIFDPTIDTAGTYTYTVAGTPPCGDASATVTVIINPLPNAGTDGTFALCETDPPQDLFNSLGGTPEVGGSWTPALSSGTGIFDPAVDAPGIYTYTVAGTPPCGSVSSQVTVTVNPIPNPGSNGTLTLCEDDTATQNLFDSLGGTPDTGGTWSPALASGTGIFDPTIDTAGTYTYTLTGTPPCGDASAAVTVIINSLPIAGTDGTLDLCETDPPQDLFNSLGGTPDAGGTWTPSLTSGTGIFDPAIDASGIYTYTVTGTPPCGDAFAQVTVTVNPIPNPGSNGTLTLCEEDTSPQNLFDSLGGTPDSVGTWSPALTSGTGIFDPTMDAQGTYTYTVAGTPPCGDASATVTVIINPLPNAGTDGTLELCETDPPQDLFNSLGGTPDAGGTWTPSLTSGTGIFDPAIDAPGIYTYTVIGTPPCGDASATVTITVNPSPDPGLNGTLTLCETDTATQNLFDSLGGTPVTGGTWSPALTSGSGIFDPTIDAAGTYTYTVAGTPPCGDASATVTVLKIPIPDAGTDGILSICSNDAPQDLFNSLGGTPDAGGSWSPTLASGTGIFDPSVDASGTYTYTLSGPGFCGEDTSEVIVDVIPEPDSTGLTLAIDSVCLNEPSTVTISGATVLLDGSYSFTYTLSGANNSQTTIVIPFVNGTAVFNIPASLLTNAGTTTFTLIGLTSETTSCSSNVTTIPSVQFNINQDPTPQLITNGDQFCLEDNPTIADLSGNVLGTNPVIWFDVFENGTAYADDTVLIDGTTYYGSALSPDGCNNGVRLAVTVSIESCEELELIIPDGFSPNGDTINDDFLIKNLRELYPDFKLQIYNRYGNILYEGDINTANWNGTSNKGRELGDSVLPIGVYFFILELHDSTNRTIQGRVYLSR